MKILLLGDYNSSHYSLKEGLEKLGHEATVIGSGDGFKSRKVDIFIKQKFRTGLSGKFTKLLFKLTGFHLSSWHTYSQLKKKLPSVEDYDIIQLINESTFKTIPKIEKKIYQSIIEKNNNVFLLSCGTDYPSVKFADDNGFEYSILTPYKKGLGSKKEFWHALMYLEKEYLEQHKYLYSHIKGVIASDLDYYIPLKNHPKCLGMIPHAINIDKLPILPMDISNRIIIFHGINRQHYYKKGNYLFQEGIHLLKENHRDKIEIIEVESLPYNQYIQSFDKAHIVLDQVFAYDQGYNALEAMAKGKVVFTGAEKEWLDYYQLKEDTVAINAEPSVSAIYKKLEWLILNPERILEISRNARKFVEKEHGNKIIAQQFLSTWEKALSK